MSLRRRRIPIAVVMSAWLLAGLAVAESSGATTTAGTVTETTVGGTSESVAETSDTVAGTGSSQRLTPRPAGETDAPLGYMEYLPPDYDDDGSSPLLVALQGFDKSGPGTEVALHKVLGEGIPRLIQDDVWPAERPFVVLVPQHDYPQDYADYSPCDTAEHSGSCSMAIQHELGHPENSICVTPTELHDFLSYAIGN